MERKILATSDVSHLRRSAMLYVSCLCNHLEALLDGAADPEPEQWGKTTEIEKFESGIGCWPGVTTSIKPANATLRLYGGAAFERVVHEFRCATYSMECPIVSREKVANILLAHAGRGGSRGVTEAAAEIARAAAKTWLAPLLTQLVIGLLLFCAIFLILLLREIIVITLDVCCGNDFLGSLSSGVNSISRVNQVSAGSFFVELSKGRPALHKDMHMNLVKFFDSSVLHYELLSVMLMQLLSVATSWIFAL